MQMHTQEPQPLDKLVLFVTDVCNLRCAYCYVSHQAANGTRSMMTEDVARRIAQRVLARRAPCDFVQFFGGEPTLNMPAMTAFVDEARGMVRAGTIASTPHFGIVTNGASADPNTLVAFCNAYDVSATVSLDGPQRVHDALRPAAGGRGSFDAALLTIRALQDAHVPVAIETVYTAAHIDAGCTIVDVFRLAENLGVRKVVLHTVYPPAPSELLPFDDTHFRQLLDLHIDAARWWFESLVQARTAPLDVYFRDLLVPLLQGAGVGVAGGKCPAGDRVLAVGPDGSAYSCHLLYRLPRYLLGDVLSDDTVGSLEPLPLRTADFPECPECFARHWCLLAVTRN